MPLHQTSVAIIGAGPCGLAMALQLAQREIPFVVFEKKSSLSQHPKAMGVSRRSAEIFRQLGVLSALYEPCGRMTEGPHPILNIFARSFIGEEWGRIPLTEPLSPLSPGPSFHCPQTLMEQVLFDAVEKIAPGSFRLGEEALEVKEEEGVVTFAVGGEAWSADWLVAADGAGGQIRHGLHVESDGPGEMGHFLNTYFRAAYGPALAGRHSLLFTVLDDEVIEFFVTVNGEDLWLMHHFLRPGESPADYPPERLAGIIRKASGLPEIPVEILSVSPWVMSPKVSRRFRLGRILFVGDSAARMSPAGGLGLNTGLQSAHNLAWKLAAVVKGEATPTLLDSYEEERRGAALWTLEHTNRNAGEVFGIARAAMARDWAEVRNLISHNGRAGSRLGIDLGLEYGTGAFLPDGTAAPERSDPVNDYVPQGRPGGRAPHFVLEDGRSVLDLFGPGFTLLAAGHFEGWVAEVSVHVLPETSPFGAPYGVETGGCVLVRPDGYVAARWRQKPAAGEVSEVLRKLLIS